MGAVVDPHSVGLLVLDDGAVHERPEVLQRLVVQVGAGDPFRDGLSELRRDLVHVGETVGHRHRQLLVVRALGDAGGTVSGVLPRRRRVPLPYVKTPYDSPSAKSIICL
jgi:hypothetical protein